MTATPGYSLAVTMSDGTRHEATAVIADQVLYSTTRHKHKWPTMTEDPLLFQNFLAYAALKRTGLFDGSWLEFGASAAMVELDEDGDDTEDPTAGGSE